MVAFIAGAVAAVVGFGIGSLITPLLALKFDTRLAVAAVSVPHVVGSVLRCWMMRKDIDRGVLISFGITSAIGGLLGAIAHTYITSVALTQVFGVILMFAAVMGLGVSDRLKLRGVLATTAGAASGFLGGLVGNQGGIRSAAMLAFGLSPSSFVATATAIGVVVDLARMPVYIYSQYRELSQIWLYLLVASIAVVGGTFGGTYIVHRIDRQRFKQVVCCAIFLLGAWMLWSGISATIR